jgi:hypothetical protein
MESENNILEILTSIHLIITLFGLIGNILTIVIFSRKVFANNSINIYARAIAIFDCFIFIDAINEVSILFYNTDLFQVSSLYCKVKVYNMGGILTIPEWILVALSIDKMLSVLRCKNKLLKKKSFQFGIVTTIALIHCLAYLVFPIYLELKTLGNSTQTICIIDSPYWSLIMLVVVIENSILPFLILIVITAVTVRTIFFSKRRLHLANANAGIIRRGRRNRGYYMNRERMFAINSIVRYMIFVVFKLPVVIMVIFELQAHSIVFSLTMILCNADNSVGLLVNVVTNSIFRNELKRLFFKKNNLNFI